MTYDVFMCDDIEGRYFAQVSAESDRRQLEMERQEDQDHEEELARQCVDDDDIDTWPWYADAPCEEVQSEIFDEQPIGVVVDDTINIDINVNQEEEQEYDYDRE